MNRLLILAASGALLLTPGCAGLGHILSLPRTLLTVPARVMRFADHQGPAPEAVSDFGVLGPGEIPRYPEARLKPGRQVAGVSAPSALPAAAP